MFHHISFIVIGLVFMFAGMSIATLKMAKSKTYKQMFGRLVSGGAIAALGFLVLTFR